MKKPFGAVNLAPGMIVKTVLLAQKAVRTQHGLEPSHDGMRRAHTGTPILQQIEKSFVPTTTLDFNVFGTHLL